MMYVDFFTSTRIGILIISWKIICDSMFQLNNSLNVSKMF